jgi:hypothetical protein
MLCHAKKESLPRGRVGRPDALTCPGAIKLRALLLLRRRRRYWRAGLGLRRRKKLHSRPLDLGRSLRWTARMSRRRSGRREGRRRYDAHGAFSLLLVENLHTRRRPRHLPVWIRCLGLETHMGQQRRDMTTKCLGLETRMGQQRRDMAQTHACSYLTSLSRA